MSNIYRNPNNSYSHRTVEIPPNSRVLFISGQTATDENGKTPADPDIQAEIVYKKILESLEQADMTKDDLVKTNVYITDPKFITSVYKASQKYNPKSKTKHIPCNKGILKSTKRFSLFVAFNA